MPAGRADPTGRLSVLLGLAGGWLTILALGCAQPGLDRAMLRSARAEAARAAPLPVEPYAVTVALARAEHGFVVIDFGPRAVPATGTRLKVFRAGRNVGTVRITEPVRGRFATADIVEGDVRVGDEIR